MRPKLFQLRFLPLAVVFGLISYWLFAEGPEYPADENYPVPVIDTAYQPNGTRFAVLVRENHTRRCNGITILIGKVLGLIFPSPSECRNLSSSKANLYIVDAAAKGAPHKLAVFDKPKQALEFGYANLAFGGPGNQTLYLHHSCAVDRLANCMPVNAFYRITPDGKVQALSNAGPHIALLREHDESHILKPDGSLDLNPARIPPQWNGEMVASVVMDGDEKKQFYTPQQGDIYPQDQQLIIFNQPAWDDQQDSARSRPPMLLVKGVHDATLTRAYTLKQGQLLEGQVTDDAARH